MFCSAHQFWAEMSKTKVSWLLCIGRLVSKTDNVMHFACLVKQASVDLVSDLYGLWAIFYGAQSPDATWRFYQPLWWCDSLGRVAEGWSCCLWQSGQMTKLPEYRIAWGQVAPADHPTLGWTLGHGFIPIGCHLTSGYVLLCTPVLGRNV